MLRVGWNLEIPVHSRILDLITTCFDQSMPKQKKTPKRVQLPEPSISSSPIKEKEDYLLYAPRRTRFAKRSLPNGDTSVTDTPINYSEKSNRTINCSGTVVRKKYNTRKSTQLEGLCCHYNTTDFIQ